MTNRNIPNLPHARDEGLIAATNDLITSLGNVGLLPHYSVDLPSAMAILEATPVASSLATSRVLAIAIANASLEHGLNVEAHAAVDSTLDTAATAADAAIGALETALNAIKAELNTHLVNTTVHRGLGTVTHQLVTATDATGSNQTLVNNLCNDLQTVLLKHAKTGARPLVLVRP